MKKTIATLGLLTALFSNASSASSIVNLTNAWETKGFKNPESVLYDNERKIMFVSNINGGPLDKDGNGYISVIDTKGDIKNAEWVTGLNAPKGLGRVNDKLYVTDIDTLVEIGIDNGRILNRYTIADAKFMNDIATDAAGNVYASDMLSNRIYRLQNGQLEIWFESDDIPAPNGLHVESDRLVVGSWGKMTDGFKTDIAGHLMTVSITDKSVSSLGSGTPVGNLDGVESAGKSEYYVTDWLNGGLFVINTDGSSQKILTLEQGSADLEVISEKKLIVIPMMLNNKVIAYSIN